MRTNRKNSLFPYYIWNALQVRAHFSEPIYHPLTVGPLIVILNVGTSSNLVGERYFPLLIGIFRILFSED